MFLKRVIELCLSLPVRNNAGRGKENQLDSTGPVDSVKKKTFKCISKVFKTQKLSVISYQHNPCSYFG